VMGPVRSGEPPIIALAGSDAGFFLLDANGNTLRHHPIGHAQTVCVANLLGDVPGLQIAVNTYWGEPGITLVLDDQGRVLDEFEPMHYACLLQPVNWMPDDTELLLLSTHPQQGGLINGHGQRAVIFPDDGHPVLCCDARDIDGDGIDEILTWDYDGIWIYKADPPPDGPSGCPLRNPFANDSNYRGQYSFPAC
jgi:rhamnogalacturonan endolyase